MTHHRCPLPFQSAEQSPHPATTADLPFGYLGKPIFVPYTQPSAHGIANRVSAIAIVLEAVYNSLQLFLLKPIPRASCDSICVSQTALLGFQLPALRAKFVNVVSDELALLESIQH